MQAQTPQWAGSGPSDNEVESLGQRRSTSNFAGGGRNSSTHELSLRSHTSKHPQNRRNSKKYSALGYHEKQSDSYEDDFEQLNVSISHMTWIQFRNKILLE